MGSLSQGTDERSELQRRTLRVLIAGQVVGAAALGSAITVGAFVIQDILGEDTPWSGAAAATVTTGTAFMVQFLARLMQRRGRRPGLQLGYTFAAVGGFVAALGVELSWLPVFLAGLFLYGTGQASNLLARYAATDLAEPEQRSRAMSVVVFSSTVGAVLGPLLVAPAEHAGQLWFSLEKYSGPWIFSSICFLAAAANTALRLRPDPLVVSGGVSSDTQHQPIRLFSALRSIAEKRDSRLAVTAMVVSQLTMVGVMAMTPVHLKLHGHEGISQIVVSLHIAGMYGFSPLVGRLSDARGRLVTIRLGAAALMAATMLAALSGDVEQLLFPSLWLLGLGWSCGLIGGSSLLIDSTPVEERVAVQGVADLAMSLSGGVAGFASGFIRRALGFHLLASMGVSAAGALLAVALAANRRFTLGQVKQVTDVSLSNQEM